MRFSHGNLSAHLSILFWNYMSIHFFACARIPVQIQLMKKDASGNLPKVVLIMGLESWASHLLRIFIVFIGLTGLLHFQVPLSIICELSSQLCKENNSGICFSTGPQPWVYILHTSILLSFLYSSFCNGGLWCNKRCLFWYKNIIVASSTSIYSIRMRCFCSCNSVSILQVQPDHGIMVFVYIYHAQ